MCKVANLQTCSRCQRTCSGQTVATVESPSWLVTAKHIPRTICTKLIWREIDLEGLKRSDFKMHKVSLSTIEGPKNLFDDQRLPKLLSLQSFQDFDPGVMAVAARDPWKRRLRKETKATSRQKRVTFRITDRALPRLALPWLKALGSLGACRWAFFGPRKMWGWHLAMAGLGNNFWRCFHQTSHTHTEISPGD